MQLAHKTVVVIGLGQFGMRLATALAARPVPTSADIRIVPLIVNTLSKTPV